MVRYGMVWYDMGHYGMVWYIVLYGVWYGMEYGMVCDMVYGMVLDMICGTVHSMLWYGIWCGVSINICANMYNIDREVNWENIISPSMNYFQKIYNTNPSCIHVYSAFSLVRQKTSLYLRNPPFTAKYSVFVGVCSCVCT